MNKKPRPQDGRNPSRSSSGSRSKSRQDKGPETSTPIKTVKKKNDSKLNGSEMEQVDGGSGVRRSLEKELSAYHVSENGSIFDHGPGEKDNVWASKPKEHQNHLGPSNSSKGAMKYGQDLSTTFGSSLSKKSFVSEFENGTIQAQRQELELLITELKDRDNELNEMVKSHQEQLAGWEEDRDRLQHLEQKHNHSEGELKRKNNQIRALVGRLKMKEASEKEAVMALEKSQSQVKSLTDEFSNSHSQLAETKEKNRELGSLVRDLSDTLGKLELKERDMLSVIQQKEHDLNSASKSMTSLNEKMVALMNKYQESQQECDQVKSEFRHVRDTLAKYNSEVEKLKSDLDRSRQEEDESKMEIERGKRDVDRMKMHLKMMHEKEKRQEELIASQRKKQERTDAELASLRQLYERQQKDMALLYMNLERTNDLLKQEQTNDVDQCNISLLLQSPTPAIHPRNHHNSVRENELSMELSHSTQHMDTHSTHKQNSHIKYNQAHPESPTHHATLQSDEVYATGTPLDMREGGGGASKNTPGEPHPKPRDPKHSKSNIPVRIDNHNSNSNSDTPRPSTPVSQLNESIKDISEQSKKLAQIIESSRVKRAEDGNNVMQELAKQLAISKEKETLVRNESQVTDVSVEGNMTGSTGRGVSMRQYQYPYSGTYQNTSDISEVRGNSRMEPAVSQESMVEMTMDGFSTPPRTSHRSFTTPSPPQDPVSVHYVSAQRSSLEESGGNERSRHSAGSSRMVSFQEERQAEGYEGLRDYPPDPASPGLSSEASQDTSILGTESPTSKLHRLLTESRQMVMTLERSTYPPFFPQEAISPIKPEEEDAEETP